ncbi:MAG: hypothetical protein ACJ8EY_03650 [Sphingomicrobium sp.]
MSISERNPEAAVELDSEALERSYGTCASVYAQVRAEAARTRGAADAADHWKEVEQKIETEEGHGPD